MAVEGCGCSGTGHSEESLHLFSLFLMFTSLLEDGGGRGGGMLGWWCEGVVTVGQVYVGMSRYYGN